MSVEKHARREILKAFGIGVPAAIVAASNVEASQTEKMTPRDVFEIYVAEYLALLPEHFAKGRTSNVRMMAEAQGAALAMVLARLQAENG